MAQTPLLEPGRNCWRVANATRAAVIIDAEDYFRAARHAMLMATEQILLVGWDFDARIRFKDEQCSDDGPEKVGAFISWLTRRTPGLQVHILRWDTGAIKTLFHGRTLLRIFQWARDDQVHLRFDANHPFGGSHHQKVLVIDDSLAFCGGIDMTVDRWDTREHLDAEPHRLEPNGNPYGPWHDATTMLEGPVAASLGGMCRERWRMSGGEIKAPQRKTGGHWPAETKPEFIDAEVGIARTIPEMPDQEPVHEIEALYVDLIARAQRWIYAESQYFASRKVAEAIAKRLEEAEGPEIVIVHPTTAEGWLEPIAMDWLAHAWWKRSRSATFTIA
jgi:phosphatidylserine/phosphatidylglycerophosphate/cardiolipin synthase-like enzyme